MDARLPADFVTFADSVHGRRLTESIVGKAIPFLIAGCMMAIIAVFTDYSRIILSAAIFSFILASIKMLSMRSLIAYPLAINSAHPWSHVGDRSGVISQADDGEGHDGEDVVGKEGDAIARVMLRTPEKNWFELGDSPIRVARNPLANNWELVANDRESTRLGQLVGVKKRKMEWFEQLANLALMQAQIFNGGARDDAFADAREREEQESGLLEREWENTSPGLLGLDDVLSVGMRSAKRAKTNQMTNSAPTAEDEEE